MMLFLEFNLVNTNKPITINVAQIIAIEESTPDTAYIELANGMHRVVTMSYKEVIEYLEFAI